MTKNLSPTVIAIPSIGELKVRLVTFAVVATLTGSFTTLLLPTIVLPSPIDSISQPPLGINNTGGGVCGDAGVGIIGNTLLR